MISNFKLRTRLLAGYLLPIVAIVLIGITSFYISRVIQQQFEEITNTTVPTVRALNNAKIAGLRLVATANEVALLKFFKSEEGLAQEEAESAAGFELYNAAVAAYAAIVRTENSAKEDEFLQKLKLSGQKLYDESNRLITIVEQNAAATDILAAKHALEETEQAYLQIVDQALVYEAELELAERDAYLDRTILNAFFLIGGLTLTALLVVLTASRLIYRSIIDPLQHLRTAAIEIEQGQVPSLGVVGNVADELGQLTRAFNQMAVTVHTHATTLEEQKQQLQQSNADLQQFAYVASHDLQEPLRMVTSYLQLLERRYKGKLDTDATEFIAFAVDGATRMKILIQALLTYSRVGTHVQPQNAVDCQLLLGQVVDNLQIAIQESNAQIRWDPLPTVRGDATQLAQLLQNLIGNAIKFRSERRPEIQIGAQPFASTTTEREPLWQFWVRDNGIGIEPQYFERIFLIFQRLHPSEAYPGTGLGLAICKRIVDRHGGKMWVESRFGEGTTFYFTLGVMGTSNSKRNYQPHPSRPQLGREPLLGQ